ncbi:MAG: FAD-binding protein [Deltaproteobacteria bacterium]|nr:FAD-binding protein [Deltaproteobacteria bacterium]
MEAKKKVEPQYLPPEVYLSLEDIVGKEYITQERAILETYSKFSIDITGYLKKHAKDPSNIPACVVLPSTTEEVQAIVRLANKHKIPFVPFTNGQLGIANYPTKPVPTIFIHFSRMNKILEINTKTMAAKIQPYVDYGQLQADAMKVGLWNGGTPLSTSLCKISSQTALAGLYQTSMKYGTLGKNIISLKMVLPDGEILKTGSSSVDSVDDFWEYAPGPDIYGLFRGCAGTLGIITELTTKLHPWAGEKELPEPPAGRPSIRTYREDKYDHAPPPKLHRLYWVEYNDIDSEIKALREVAHSGIGIGLNAAGIYNTYYCSTTQEQTIKRTKENFFPPYNFYVICTGITSHKQLDYADKVINKIIKETGGTLLSKDHKPEVLKVLATWNLDCIRHVCGYRMSRYSYLDTWFLSGVPAVGKDAQEIWSEAINTIGETYITDRGGVDTTPFLYASDPCGRNFFTEADVYPNPIDPKSLQQAQQLMMFSIGKTIGKKIGPGITAFGASFEPLTSFFPEMGPNVHLFMRKLRKVFDPNGVCSPGRQIFTKEELQAVPPPVIEAINQLRQMNGLDPIDVSKSQ